MPPLLASLLTVGLIVFLFRRDRREEGASRAAWLPLIWMIIICSRPVSGWLQIHGLNVGATSLEEGSPVDALVYSALIVTGLLVLRKRGVNLSRVRYENAWLAAFLLYCFLAVFWSDYPFVSFKRWIKIMGHPIMALILLTEPDPMKALVRTAKRCAYVVLPVSILFIKYYPTLGRSFDPWSGIATYTGITTNKNTLGCVCLVLGSLLGWHWLQVWHQPQDTSRRKELLLTSALLVMTAWVLKSAHSSTALVSLGLCGLTMLLLGTRHVNKRLIGVYAVATLFLLAIGEWAFGISTVFLESLGKSATLTDRSVLWQELVQIPINPIFGTGFESFWLGPRLEALWEKHWWHPNEAHNGYLEIYLNLGICGLIGLAGFLFATYRKAKRDLLDNFQWGRYRMAFLAAVVAYNFTEASFKALHPVWFILFIIALDYRRFYHRETETGAIPAQQEELVHSGPSMAYPLI